MPADFLDIAYAQQASIARDVASRLMRQEALYWSPQETISATSAQRPLPPVSSRSAWSAICQLMQVPAKATPHGTFACLQRSILRRSVILSWS